MTHAPGKPILKLQDIPLTSTLTRSGRVVDLLHPTPDMIDFGDIAFHLAHINRFAGAVGGYSVAQHSVEGARAIQRDNSDPLLALYFLLHDAHEYVLGDITRPVRNALDECDTQSRVYPTSLINCLAKRFDAAILAAAGLAPPNDDILRRVHEVDMRMLATELHHFFGVVVEEAAFPRFDMKIPVRSPADAAHHWRTTLITWQTACGLKPS